MSLQCLTRKREERTTERQLDTTKVDSVVRKRLEFISGVSLPEATADVVSLLLSCSSFEVLYALFNWLFH